MKKNEAVFQVRFGRWLQYVYTGSSTAFELKRTLTSSLPLSAIKEHQTRSLLMARTGLYYKTPDDSRSFKPFDTFFLRDADGYLAVAYGPRLIGFYLVDIDTIEKLRSDGMRSLTEDLAKQHGQYHELRGSSSV